MRVNESAEHLFTILFAGSGFLVEPTQSHWDRLGKSLGQTQSQATDLAHFIRVLGRTRKAKELWHKTCLTFLWVFWRDSISEIFEDLLRDSSLGSGFDFFGLLFGPLVLPPLGGLDKS